MLRAVSTIMVVIFALAIFQFLAGAAIEPIGEEITSNYDTSDVRGESTINSLYDAIFKWIPMVFFAGMMGWAILWVFRKERLMGGRR